MTYDEAVSYYFLKAGKILFVLFVSLSLVAGFIALLHFMGPNQYWYFIAGVIYCGINRLLWQATERWRKA